MSLISFIVSSCASRQIETLPGDAIVRHLKWNEKTDQLLCQEENAHSGLLENIPSKACDGHSVISPGQMQRLYEALIAK